MQWRIGECGDGAVVLEYVRPTWRVGVALEQDPSESGWYCTFKNHDELDKCGRIGVVVHSLLARLLRVAG